jgi:hypothetical protein
MKDSTTIGSQVEVKVHRKGFNRLVDNVAYCLRHLNDRIMLNRSPLARLTYVRLLAQKHYKSHVLPRGFALQKLLKFCIQRITGELGGDPVLSRSCQYLTLVSKGLSQNKISSELGLSREHIGRLYRRKAIELLAEDLLHVIKTGQYDG